MHRDWGGGCRFCCLRWENRSSWALRWRNLDRVGARLTPLPKHRLHGWLWRALLKLHGTKRPRQTQGSWPLPCEVRALTTYRGCFRCLGSLSHLSSTEVLHMSFYIPHLGLPLMLGQLTLRCSIRSELVMLSTHKRHHVTLLLWPHAQKDKAPLCAQALW